VAVEQEVITELVEQVVRVVAVMAQHQPLMLKMVELILAAVVVVAVGLQTVILVATAALA
jgi:hypothetical protein